MSRDPIQDLVHRYADAVVMYDGEQWGATWGADAEWSLGPGRELKGRDAIVEFWHRAMSGFTAVVQTCLNGTYELDEAAGTGTGRWHIQESMQRADGTRSILLAHYNDKYVLEDGEWKFADRQLVPHYSGPPDLSGKFLNVIEPK
jgi:hypothetical protein